MKLRYQLRGLGIGVMMTALLTGIASKDGTPMSDAEIKAKALELGMVESSSLKLSDVAGVNPTAEPAENPGAGSTGDSAGSSEPDSNEGVSGNFGPDSNTNPSGSSGADSAGDSAGSSGPDSNTDASGSGASNPDAAAADKPAENADGQNITVVIASGEIASEISRKMAEAGLVEDADAFERYLCEIGCTRSIWDGTYTFSAGVSMEDIAKAIARLE